MEGGEGTFVGLPCGDDDAVRADAVCDFDDFGRDVVDFLEVDEGFGADALRERFLLLTGVDDDRSHAHCP